MTMPVASASRRQFLAALATTAALPSGVFAMANHPAMRALIDRYVAEKKVPSMVVAIGGRTGEPDFLSAGRLELGAGPPAGPDSLYRIYSMTKPVTGCAIMMLVEEGKLALDTPLADIFPAYGSMKVLTDPANGLETRPATKPILIRHLVTHSSGLTYSSMAPAPLRQLYAEKGIEPAQTSLADEAKTHRPAGLIAFAEAAAAMPLLFEPGSKWQYSIGLDVAGAVVEKVSGMPFDTFLERRIFVPLGMADTGFTVPAAKIGRFVANYRATPQGLVLIESGRDSVYARKPAFPYGGAGLVSSARDYSRFMAMLLGEGQLGRTRILKTETARLMMSNLMEGGITATTATGDTGFGAGGRSVLTATQGGEGVGTYGWSGAAGTHAFVDRANGVYAVLMTQFMDVPTNPIYAEFGRALYSDLAHA